MEYLVPKALKLAARIPPSSLSYQSGFHEEHDITVYKNKNPPTPGTAIALCPVSIAPVLECRHLLATRRGDRATPHPHRRSGP
jgi:hypothetical protein